MDGIRLGPFAVQQPIGRGGMGLVWGGAHARSGTPVAVKIVAPAGAAERAFTDSFEAEARAVAQLDHPHIVTVLDYGRIGPAAAKHCGVALGSPYLVMERIDGTLRTVPLAWPPLRRALLELLDALAAAHAVGITHRDLKPGNVLVRPDGAAVLTDFGLAHAARSSLPAEVARSGTPAYMAPEQFDGRWRDFGPWTDLYALGALGWRLASGRAPFPTSSWTEAARAHARRALEPLRPRMWVPTGFVDWLHALLEKDPSARYGRAAVAAADLRGLAQGPSGAAPPAAVSRPSAVTVVDAAAAEVPRGGFGCDLRPPRAPLPPLPERAPQPERPTSAWLSGVGRGLVGLRRVPLVGRTQERARLWEAARRAQTGPVAVVLRGGAGSGKTRLAEWIGEVLHARGAATVLWASWGQVPDASDGLGPMIASALRTSGLGPAPALRRTAALLDVVGAAGDAPAVAALTHPTRDADVRLASGRERHEVVLRLLERLGGRRLPVLHLDDVQWGPDAVDFAHTALARVPPVPLLIVLTAREEALTTRPGVAEQLRALVAAGADEVSVGPLPDADGSALVGALLGLEHRLARQVAERTEGNPLFAIQLVEDWAQRGLLVSGPGGWRLTEEAGLPAHIDALWRHRVTRLLGERGDDAAAVELSAVLGREVDEPTWLRACTEARLTPSADLVDLLIRHRLARSAEPGRWRLVHGMLRESLLEQAQQSGRLATLHSAAAAALSGSEPGMAARRGRHLLRAGSCTAALPELLEALREAERQGHAEEIRALVGNAQEAIAGAPELLDDPASAEPGLALAQMEAAQTRYELALEAAGRVAEDARARGWIPVLARALSVQGGVHLARNATARAEAALTRARDLLAGADEGEAMLGCLTRLALLRCRQGDFEAAIPLVERAEVLARKSGSHHDVGRCLVVLGHTLHERGDLPRARRCLERARGAYEQGGARLGQAVALDGLAMVALDEGGADEALAHIEEGLALAAAVGSLAGEAMHADAGAIYLARGDVAGARMALERARPVLARAGAARAAQIDAGLVLCAALEGDRAAAEAALAKAISGLEGRHVYGRLVAQHLERAGRVALGRGWGGVARRALALCAEQWRGLTRPDRADAAERLASSAPDPGG